MLQDRESIRIERRRSAENALSILNKARSNGQEYKNWAIVFDIDDTLISSDTGERIVPICNVYHYIRQLHIPIFIITARDKAYTEETVDELHNSGIIGYNGLYLVGNREYGNGSDKAYRKARVRKAIEDQGYEILLNLGDDIDDFKYGHYSYGIKLPYLYY